MSVFRFEMNKVEHYRVKMRQCKMVHAENARKFLLEKDLVVKRGCVSLPFSS